MPRREMRCYMYKYMNQYLLTPCGTDLGKCIDTPECKALFAIMTDTPAATEKDTSIISQTEVRSTACTGLLIAKPAIWKIWCIARPRALSAFVDVGCSVKTPCANKIIANVWRGGWYENRPIPKRELRDSNKTCFSPRVVFPSWCCICCLRPTCWVLDNYDSYWNKKHQTSKLEVPQPQGSPIFSNS